MAKYVLEDGELELLTEIVDCSVDGKLMPNGRIIITDRRVVLLAPKGKPPSFWMKMFGPLVGRVVATAMGTLQLSYQISRAEFDDVDAPDTRLISFHSKGSGYAHVSFAVVSMTSVDMWRQRMVQWVAGTLTAAPLPQAKLIDR